MPVPDKPTGGKAYGHIPHLPGSRMGPADHHCSPGQARIATEKARDRHDRVVVTEKVDGSCVAAFRRGEDVLAVGRAGWLARTSKFEQHQLFDHWVRSHADRFRAVLEDGERLVGEWLAQAHGTRYALPHEPFVAFDLMRGPDRTPTDAFRERVSRGGFVTPRVLSDGGPFPLERALDAIATSGHGAVDPVEGAVWRVERRGVFDYVCKYVRPDKVDGSYLPEVSGGEAVWNWRPSKEG